MKILVVCQHYAPEPFRLHEICEELVARGHQVTAVVGLPNYPTGRIPREYRFFRRRRENLNGVRVLRCLEIGRRPGKLGLAVNYVSYLTSATLRLLFLRRDFDVIYAYSSSPILMTVPAALFRKWTGIPLMIYVMDIWPACLSAMNVREDAFLYRFMRRVSRWTYAAADALTYTSRSFRAYIRDTHGIDMPESDFNPQFADDLFLTPARAERLPGTHYLFAGNVGYMQSVDTILRAASRLRGENIVWHIVGDGSALADCERLAESLELGASVVFHGRLPVGEMPALYAMADALVVTMRPDPLVSFTLPGKVQSYLAAGKAVLGAADGETRDVVRDAACGVCVPAGDDEALAEAARKLAQTGDFERLGRRARAYYDAHYRKRGHMDRLENRLTEIAETAKERGKARE